MYFSDMPKIVYPFIIDGKQEDVLLVDITSNVRFFSESLKSIQLFDNYIMQDGETPEMVSDKFYGNPNYYWIIMIANDKYNYVDDFPMSQAMLEVYLDDLYGEDIDSIAYYVKNGLVVDSDEPGATPVTNREYENMVNDEKRHIKIIPREYINQISLEYKRIMNG